MDVLDNARNYLSLNSGFAKAFAFLLRPDLPALPAGKYEIDGEAVYATVSRDPGRRKEDAFLETHEKYIDIQVVLKGTDDMGWKPRSVCKKPNQDYDEAKDIRFFSDEPDAWLTLKSGSFAVFFPEDAHMPLISPGQLHKVIVKVSIT